LTGIVHVNQKFNKSCDVFMEAREILELQIPSFMRTHTVPILNYWLSYMQKKLIIIQC